VGVDEATVRGMTSELSNIPARLARDVLVRRGWQCQEDGALWAFTKDPNEPIGFAKTGVLSREIGERLGELLEIYPADEERFRATLEADRHEEALQIRADNYED
jgi:hypothetical protein